LPADDPRSPENIARRRALAIAERAPNGQLYPGSRIPGAGRKPDAENITALTRIHTQRTVEVLREVMDDPKAPQTPFGKRLLLPCESASPNNRSA
jgi:hypothetical protein